MIKIISSLFFISLFYSCSGQLDDPRYVESIGGGNSALSPVLQIHNLQGSEFVQGGQIKNVRFTVTDALGFNSNRLEYSNDNGVTWTLMTSATGQSALTFATVSGVESEFDWAVPEEPNCSAGSLTSDSSSYKIRIYASGRPDAPITLRESAATFTVDSCAPVLTNGQFSTSTQSRGYLQFLIQDIADAFSLSPIRAVCLKKNNSTKPTAQDPCWRSLKSLRVTPDITPAPLTVQYFAGFNSATFNFYLWAMDQAENISDLSSTENVDQLTSVVRDCSPASECTVPLISASLTAHVDNSLSSFVVKTGAPDSLSVQTMIDPNYFVISANGTMYFRNSTTGSISKINLLSDSSVTELIPQGSQTDGNQDTAEVLNPSRLAMDFEENLYILDFDRIRKVEFTTESTFVVTTVVGGGSDSTTSSLRDPLSLEISPLDRTTANGASSYWYSTFQVLPTGAIYFSASNPQNILDPGTVGHSQLKFYDPEALNKVTSIDFSGTGVLGNSSQDVTNLVLFSNFGLVIDLTTSSLSRFIGRFCEAIGTCASQTSITFSNEAESVGATGQAALASQWSNGSYFNSRRGDLYHINAYEGQFQKYNSLTFNWDLKLGTGTYASSFCADGTSALSCDLRLWDAYVGHNDQIYFIDFGRLRFVDSDGKVRTLLQ